MQTAVVEVLIKGNVQHVVAKLVTPAEAVIIKHLHGHDSVINPVINGNIKRSQPDELDRLRAEYGVDVVTEVYPGAAPRLPETLVEAGFTDVQEPETKPAKKAAAAE